MEDIRTSDSMVQEEERLEIERDRRELDEQFASLKEEQKRFEEERKNIQEQLETEKKRMQYESAFFDQKMAILKSGFAQLETDRNRFEKEKIRFEAEQKVMEDLRGQAYCSQNASLFFKGVHNQLTLKKRYKDLIKIFHPDNICGDTDVIQQINREYEQLRQELNYCRNA